MLSPATQAQLARGWRVVIAEPAITAWQMLPQFLVTLGSVYLVAMFGMAHQTDGPVRRGLRVAPMAIDRPTVSLDEGRRMIADAITTYLADPLPSSMLLIAAPAGIGKTTVGVETAERAAPAAARRDPDGGRL